MTWKDSIEIGIPEIDRQHKEICGMLDDFYNACIQGKGDEEVLRLLDFLKKYTFEHFNDEEALQLQLSYPHLKKHKQQHDRFRKRMADIRQEISDWGVTTDTVKTVNRMMTNWLIHHIMGCDADIKNYFNENMASGE